MSDGSVPNVDTPIVDFFPGCLPREKDDRKRHITIRHALTSSTGLAWDEWRRGYRDPRRMLRARDSLYYVLRKRCVDDPGATFRYSTGAYQLLAGVLWAATGELPHEFARRRLFEPLGIHGTMWAQTPDGVNCGGTHLFLSPRDMLKLGILCASNGAWHARQLVPADWILESTRVHAGHDWWEGPYGYGWWIRPFGYCAYGFGGQFIYVVPSRGLVVVMTARVRPHRHILLRDLEEHVVAPLLS